MEYQAKGLEVSTEGQPSTLDLMRPIMEGLINMVQNLAQQQQAMNATQQQIAASMNTPKEVVRDPKTGEVIGVQPVAQRVN